MITEIIDLKNSSFGCTKSGKPLEWSNGGWVGNMPMVCGGKVYRQRSSYGSFGKPLMSVCGYGCYYGNTFQTKCYTLEENGAWKEEGKAKLIRGKLSRNSGSVVIKDQLFIPEIVRKVGYNGYNNFNFEMVAPNKTTEALRLPLGHFISPEKSCIVNWDANTIMLIGGVNHYKNKATFFINVENKTVTPGPELIEGRFYHACHEMIVEGESFVIVTGGYHLKSTEILSKSSFGKGWQKGEIMNII